MDDNTEWKLTTKDLGEKLGFESVTIRKYALILEGLGYNVRRDSNDNRVYSEMDAMVFQQVKTIRERSGLSVEKSAEVVLAKLHEASNSVAPTVIPSENTEIVRYDKQYEELEGHLLEVLEVNKVLGNRLARMEDKFDEVAQRQQQQHENMTVILRTMLEVKQEIAAAKDKRSFWDKLRGK